MIAPSCLYPDIRIVRKRKNKINLRSFSVSKKLPNIAVYADGSASCVFSEILRIIILLG